MIDNAACVHILKKPTLAPRLQRWALTLQGFDVTIKHPAEYNVVTDAPSRNIPETVNLVTSFNPRQIKLAQKTDTDVETNHNPNPPNRRYNLRRAV